MGVSVVAARLLDVGAFGAFGVAYLLYVSFIGLLRAFVLEPALARPTEAIINADGVLRSAVTVGCCASIPLGIFALLSDSTTHGPVGVLALLLPGLAAFDARRYLAFAAGEPRTALDADLWWLVVTCAALTFVIASPRLHSPSAILLAWGLSGCVVVLRWFVRSTVLRPGVDWIRDSWEYSWRQFVGFAANSGVGYVCMLVVGALVGVEVVGVLRATQLLFGPLAVLYTGVIAFLVPGSPSDLPAARLVRLLIQVCGSLALVSVTLVCFYLLLPDGAGEGILGEAWAMARGAILPAGLIAVAGAVKAGANLGFLVRRAPRETLAVQMLVLPLPVVAAIIGVAIGDAEGYLWGLAAVSVAAAVVWWLRLRPILPVRSERFASGASVTHEWNSDWQGIIVLGPFDAGR